MTAEITAREGQLWSVLVTMGAATSIFKVGIPEGSKSFRLYPSGAVRYALDENPAAQATDATSPTEVADLAVGNEASATSWTQRGLLEGRESYIHLYSLAGAETVIVEFQ